MREIPKFHTTESDKENSKCYQRMLKCWDDRHNTSTFGRPTEMMYTCRDCNYTVVIDRTK